jgi:TM2 domain-containing membrane protein YozV
MKKITLLIVFLSICTFAQTSKDSNTLELQNSLKESNNKTPFLNVNFNSVAVSKKSPGLAILYSFLLPGMGELYAGNFSSGKYFTIAEGTLWGVYIGMDSYGYWLKNNYKSFAASAGGVITANKNADYYATIGNYNNIAEYNDAMALQGNFKKMMDPVSGYWSWQSTADRRNYRNLWVSGEQENNNLRFVVGALILNRVISAINAARLVAAYNKNQTADLSWNVSIGMSNPETLPSSLLFNFQTEF